MADAIFVREGVYVPGDAMETHAVRSAGPGGQNVNKVASKVEIRVDLDRIRGLDPESAQRLRRIVGRRLDSSGRLLVTSQRTRDQHRNLEDARDKIRGWVSKSLERPKRRVATGPSRSSRERRMAAKRRTSERKQSRRLRPDEDEFA